MTTVEAIAPLTDISFWARSDGLEIVLLVLGALLLVRFVAWARGRMTERIDAGSKDADALVRSEQSKHRHALAQALTWLCTILIWAVAVVLVLEHLGIAFTTLIAPLTVLGVALGLGAQRLVQDLLGGIFIIAERQYGVGDLVHISATVDTEGATGTIEDVSLRITRMRALDGEVVIFANSQVVQVSNLSSAWARAVVDVPVPVGVDVTRANEVLRQVGEAAFEDEELKPLLLDAPTVMGVQSLEAGQLSIRMVARTLPGKQFDVAREVRGRVAAAFHGEAVAAPANPAAEPTSGDA